jgi:predicted HNH restriction endonuclease
VDTNTRHQSYLKQQERGRARKFELIALFGGACCKCGYKTNHAALEFHHTVAGSKSFQLDLRSLSNRTWASVIAEAAKCMLVCANCHAEIHNPECRMPRQCREPRSFTYSSANTL